MSNTTTPIVQGTEEGVGKINVNAIWVTLGVSAALLVVAVLVVAIVVVFLAPAATSSSSSSSSSASSQTPPTFNITQFTNNFKWIQSNFGTDPWIGTVTPGTYNGTQLATQLQTALNGQTGGWTVTWNTTSERFTISNTAVFSICNNAPNMIYNTINLTQGLNNGCGQTYQASVQTDPL